MAQNKEDKVLDAILEIFVMSIYAVTNIKHVTEAGGIARFVFYHHFMAHFIKTYGVNQ